MTDRSTHSDTTLSFDVIIVGAGPAGLSAAIRLKQCNPDIQVCIVEKSAQIGGHILSGAILDPTALNQLLPDWQSLNPPSHTPVTNDQFGLLTTSRFVPLPTPPPMRNKGNYIVSLANVVRFLGTQAQALGVEIFPGFPASDILFGEGQQIIGIKTGDMGRAKDGSHKANFQPGVKIFATYTLFAEGCRGSLTEQLYRQFNLRANADPQTYAIGLKELWEIPSANHKEGHVLHTVGWPLDRHTYGGSFIYHQANNQIALGFVIGLDYSNPYLNSFETLQQFKRHPYITSLLTGGKRIAYGARALNEGGIQSIPTVALKGGAIIGCAAGFMNVPKIKGTHTAMQSAILAAEAIADQLQLSQPNPIISEYPARLKQSSIYKELHKARNIRPSFHKFGLWGGLAYSAFDSYILRGHAPWTFHHKTDHTRLKSATDCQPITYPLPDKHITFDLPSSVFLSNTNHREDQPCHLTITDMTVPITVNWETYQGPESRYCPAGVYEYLIENNQYRLQINAQNCVHCKSCDIKDPQQNIIWVPPEGGGGPNYENM